MSNQESAEKGQSQMTASRKKRFFFQDKPYFTTGTEIKPHFTTSTVNRDPELQTFSQSNR